MDAADPLGVVQDRRIAVVEDRILGRSRDGGLLSTLRSDEEQGNGFRWWRVRDPATRVIGDVWVDLLPRPGR